MENNKDRERTYLSQEEQLVNQLDAELDLRNINFATGENQYLYNRFDEEDLEH